MQNIDVFISVLIARYSKERHSKLGPAPGTRSAAGNTFCGLLTLYGRRRNLNLFRYFPSSRTLHRFVRRFHFRSLLGRRDTRFTFSRLRARLDLFPGIFSAGSLSRNRLLGRFSLFLGVLSTRSLSRNQLLIRFSLFLRVLSARNLSRNRLLIRFRLQSFCSGLSCL